jgi:ABC-type sugar transport system substrate-binding protein
MFVRQSTLRVRSWRRLLPAVAGVLVLGTSLAACGSSNSDSGSSGSSTSASSSDSGKKPVRIAMLGYDNKNNFTQWWWEGAKAEAKKQGVEVTLVDGKFDAKAQAAALQNTATSKKFDAVAVLPVDGQSLLPVVKQAGDSGLKVISGATLGNVQETNKLDPKIPEVQSVVGYETTYQAEIFAKNIKEACDAKNGPGAPCKVGLMPGAAKFPTDALQMQVVKDTLKGDKNITFAIAPDGGYARPGGYKSMTTFMQSHKDIDVLHADGDQMIAGAVQAIKENGKTPGKDIWLTGYGGTTEGFAGIKDGSWFGTVVLYPQRQARTMVDFATKAVRGEKVPPTYDLQKEPAGTVVQLTKPIMDQNPDLEGEWSEAAPR